MTERIIEKIDRLGAEAGIETMTPEIRRFAMLVREDVVAQWAQRTWVGLTDATDKEANAAFEEYAAKFDTYSDRWQDMSSADHFTDGYKAGWKAAYGIKGDS